MKPINLLMVTGEIIKTIDLAMTVGGFRKVGRENGAMECPYGGTHNGTYNAVILDKG